MSEYDRALNYCYLLLKYRNRAEKEIIDKLKQKNYCETTINLVINKLKSLNFINDEKYATEYIKYNLEKGKGIIYIKNQLIKKGIKKEIIADSIDKLKPTADSEYESAKLLFNKKIKQYENLPVNKIYNRISGYLARRGFSLETINKLFIEWNNDLKEKLV
jgi:regulatory protein